MTNITHKEVRMMARTGGLLISSLSSPFLALASSGCLKGEFRSVSVALLFWSVAEELCKELSKNANFAIENHGISNRPESKFKVKIKVAT